MFKFNLAENGTTVRTEIIAGVTTFLSMVYILAVYPSVMGGGIGLPAGGAVVAAALASFLGTFLMGALAKYPFALAPGVGIVPFFAFSVVLGMGISWQFGMMAVFVEGLVFLLCTVIPLREKIFNAIPPPPQDGDWRRHRALHRLHRASGGRDRRGRLQPHRARRVPLPQPRRSREKASAWYDNKMKKKTSAS